MTDEKHLFAFVGVDPIVLMDRKIVLALRGTDAGAEIGKWHIPGALVKAGETMTEALKRAVLEKTGLEIEPLFKDLGRSFVRMYDTPTREPRYHDIAFSFLCRPVGGAMRPGPRMTEVRAFRKTELASIEIGFDHRQILRDAIIRLESLGPF